MHNLRRNPKLKEGVRIVPNFYLRASSGKLVYRLHVRVASFNEENSTRNGAEGVLEIYSRNAKKPGLTVVVGAPVCRTSAYSSDPVNGHERWVVDTVRAGLNFASEPMVWDLPESIEWSRTYGSDLYERAYLHRIVGVWLR